MVALLALSGCTMDDEYRPNKSIGTWLWHATREDIGRVVEIFDLMERYEHYSRIDDDEALKSEYFATNFVGYTLSIEGNCHRLIYQTSYNSTIVTEISVLGNNRWHITRSGGNHYDLDLSLRSDGSFLAEFNTLSHDESVGHASFIARRNSAESSYSIEGEMVMVDTEESRKRPLTLTTNIVMPLVINREYNTLIDGELYIECYDKLYNTLDKAFVEVVKNRDDYAPYMASVYISCYGRIDEVGNNL